LMQSSLAVILLVSLHPPPPTEISTLSLHDALPIYVITSPDLADTDKILHAGTAVKDAEVISNGGRVLNVIGKGETLSAARDRHRSEEHTSELQSRFDLVCRLLLEKKKNKKSGDITI